MKVNYHIHTSYSGDLIRENALGETPEKYVLAALASGFGEICFTDHLVAGYPRTMSPYTHSMDAGRLHEYLGEIRALAKKYPALAIRAGIELDWIPEKIEGMKKIIAQNNFDCVLGSVHILDGSQVEQCDLKRDKFWANMSDGDIYARHQAYYHAVQDMAKSKICDVVTHLDLVKRDAYLPSKDVMPIIAQTVDIIAENNLCVEVNTAGIRKPIKQMHPTLDILKLCRQKNIPVTIGTDAHRVGEIEFHLEDGMNLIRAAGYTQIAVFEKRKRNLVNILFHKYPVPDKPPSSFHLL